MSPDAEVEQEVKHWIESIPERERETYRRILSTFQDAGLQFSLGGAAALGVYTGRWRNTKDLDFYVLPRDRDRAIELLTASGLEDYYCKGSYDRRWIYRACREEAIVDVIWSMANLRAEIDENWLTRGPIHELEPGLAIRFVPAEELIWSKLYVLQRERCDWPDILNLLHGVGRELDWEYLVHRVGDDLPLLRGVAGIFRWLCPSEAGVIPESLLQLDGVGGTPRKDNEACPDSWRVNLLDMRPWFGPAIPASP
jgi:hypothetical protein